MEEGQRMVRARGQGILRCDTMVRMLHLGINTAVTACRGLAEDQASRHSSMEGEWLGASIAN